MSMPYNDDSRASYVQRNGENHLDAAAWFHELGRERSMWMQLFTWAMHEEIYGEHWDLITKERT